MKMDLAFKKTFKGWCAIKPNQTKPNYLTDQNGSASKWL